MGAKAMSKIVSEYDQEITQAQTADKPMALRGRATQQPKLHPSCIIWEQQTAFQIASLLYLDI